MKRASLYAELASGAETGKWIFWSLSSPWCFLAVLCRDFTLHLPVLLPYTDPLYTDWDHSSRSTSRSTVDDSSNLTTLRIRRVIPAVCLDSILCTSTPLFFLLTTPCHSCPNSFVSPTHAGSTSSVLTLRRRTRHSQDEGCGDQDGWYTESILNARSAREDDTESPRPTEIR
jgi:hypothetical protein